MRPAKPRPTIAAMSAPRIPVLLELDPDHEPIVGVLRQPPGTDAKPFTGWLELTQLLEAIRCPAAGDQPDPPLGPARGDS
jgi:hypothetical protein